MGWSPGRAEEEDRRLLYVRVTDKGEARTLQAQQTVDELLGWLLGEVGSSTDIATAAKVLASLSRQSR